MQTQLQNKYPGLTGYHDFQLDSGLHSSVYPESRNHHSPFTLY